jgi:hypothetical protein
MFAELKKSDKLKSKISADQIMYRYLAVMTADLVYHRGTGKGLPEDFAEKVYAASVG